MHCDECENSINIALNTEGMLEKTISYKTGEALVCFNTEQISEASIVQTIKQAGKYR